LHEACQSRFAARWGAAPCGIVGFLTMTERSDIETLLNTYKSKEKRIWHGDCIVLCVFRATAPAGPDPPSGERRNLMMASEKLFGLHAAALQLRSQRMMMLASNIANAATPGYKARDLDFSKALDLAQQGSTTANAVEGAIAYRVPVQASLDGNTVEMATEQTAFAENALAYRSSLSFLSGRVNTLTRAIKGE
jgi:flagellar basal-body rod protein FlgB